MSEHDVEKLLGGFAADTLMPEERIRLYTAAMQDQQIFNVLADEQALKELLADPQVRDRLLQALRNPGTSKDRGSLSWWGWLRQPTGLAFSGGLAAVLFAGAFGTKMYLESLDRTAQSLSTENAPPDRSPQPSTPAQRSMTEPPLRSTESVDAVNQKARKDDALTDKAADGKHIPAPAVPHRDEIRKKQVEKSSAPSTDNSAPEAVRTPAGTPTLGSALPPPRARALFYGNQSAHDERQTLAKEAQTDSRSLSDPAPQASQPESKAERFTAAGAAAARRPLGLRYSFVVRETDGQEREVDAATAGQSTGPMRISVETNQDAFFQILQSLGASGTRLWWPPQETGKISLKVLAGKRTEIPLPQPGENGLLNLIIRLSPKPFAPLTMQEIGMLDRFAANLLVESTAPDGTGAQEQATYVVSQDSSGTAQMTVEILLR